jgi:Zinc-binding dehydrogenase
VSGLAVGERVMAGTQFGGQAELAIARARDRLIMCGLSEAMNVNGRSGDWITAPLLSDLQGERLRPVVARSYPFERAGEAHHYMAERRNIGKVVLTRTRSMTAQLARSRLASGLVEGVSHGEPNAVQVADDRPVRREQADSFADSHAWRVTGDATIRR